MYRTPYRLFLSSARASLNAAAARSSCATFTRRTISTESHSGHKNASSDGPWMIGSALVFGSSFLYLVSPSARKGSHEHTNHGHKNHLGEHQDSHTQHVDTHREEHVKPMIDDEGTEASGQEVKESLEKAIEADSPKDAQEQEEEVATDTMIAMQTPGTEVHSQGGSLTGATLIPESTWSATPAAPVTVDGVTNATSGRKVQTTSSDTSDPTTQSEA